MPRSPEQDRGKAVRLVRMELQARLRAAVRSNTRSLEHGVKALA
jgi:hypothetical protein